MSINRIQFQVGVSIPEFFSRQGAEEQCAAALKALRWPQGFRCRRCNAAEHDVVGHGSRTLFQCGACRRRTSLTAGTLMDSTKLPLRTWFLAIFLISQDKTGLSSLALKRHLRRSYRTAWPFQHKLMAAMARRDTEQPLDGFVQMDDAHLGGEPPGSTGRGSKNKVPFVAAVACNEASLPLQIKLSPVPAFTREAIRTWAKVNLLPSCDVLSDGLACFAGVIDADCAHTDMVVGQRKPGELPLFRSFNTIQGNLKTSIYGAHKAFKLNKDAGHSLGAFAYRFNRRFNLPALLQAVLGRQVAAQSHFLGFVDLGTPGQTDRWL